MTFAGVVVAAGSGSRAGGDKQWRALGGKAVVRWSVEALLRSGASPVIVVVARDSLERAQDALLGLDGLIAVAGGAERAD